MNSAFNNYLRLGYEHITNFSALDHILFIIVLMAVYQPKHWLKIVIAISLFTVGHSVSLTVAAMDIISVNKALIEFLIPLTIVLTALFNLSRAGQDPNSKSKNWLALIFGLIHGLGFSNYYEMLVMGEGNYWSALLPFNLGVELGQLTVVFVTLMIMIIFQYIMNTKNRDWNLFISGAGFGLALIMCIENWPFSG